jgi:hypothetical protein
MREQPAERKSDSIDFHSEPPSETALNLPKESGRSGDEAKGSEAKESKSKEMKDFLRLKSSLPLASRSLTAEKKKGCERGKEDFKASKGKERQFSTQKQAHLAI